MANIIMLGSSGGSGGGLPVTKLNISHLSYQEIQDTMGYATIQVTAGGQLTEIEYIQTIVDAIVGIDSRITCNTTVAAQYSDSSATATFNFDINGKYLVRFKRRNTNNAQTQGYIFSIIVNEIEYVVSPGLRLWSSSIYPSGKPSANAHFKVVRFSSNDDVFLWFGVNYDGAIADTYPSSYSSALIYDDSDVAYCTAVYNSNNAISQELYRCSDAASGYGISNTCAYVDTSNYVAILDNLNAIIVNSNTFSSYAKTLKSCSTLGLGTFISVNSDKYIAISPNILEPTD